MCWRSIMCILYQCITLADVSLYPFTKVVLLLLCCYCVCFFFVCVCVFWGGVILEWLWCLCCFNGMRDWLLEVDVHYVCSMSRSVWFCRMCFNHYGQANQSHTCPEECIPKIQQKQSAIFASSNRWTFSHCLLHHSDPEKKSHFIISLLENVSATLIPFIYLQLCIYFGGVVVALTCKLAQVLLYCCRTGLWLGSGSVS